MSESKTDREYPDFAERFPSGFMNIGGKTFKWVMENKKEWVEFVLNKMKNATGLFKDFQDYCQLNYKLGNGSPVISNNRNP